MILTLFLTFSLAQAMDCPTRLRAIFDVGSGSTKLAVSEVEICPGETHLRRFLDESTSLNLALEASKDSEGRISAAALDQLTHALIELKEKAFAAAKAQAPNDTFIEIAAAGTHAVRTAKNLDAVIAAAAKAGIPLTALTQEQEALSGYHGALIKSAPKVCKPEQRLLVWDVGGGSQQFILANTDHKQPPIVTGLALGAESFKQHLRLKLKSPKSRAAIRCKDTAPDSPNPLGDLGRITAREVAELEAKALPKALSAFPAGSFCAVGIGGVHGKAIAAKIDKLWTRLKDCACKGISDKACEHTNQSYSRSELECLQLELAKKTDCDPEIRGPYASTNVSSLFMMDAFMQALHIDKVHTESVNMGHGLATDRKVLRFTKLEIGK